MKIAITGSTGLLSWHTAARLHAQNCAARYKGEAAPYEVTLIDRAIFNDPAALSAALDGADSVLHFAGITRGDADEVRNGNRRICETLVAGLHGARPHIVHANSIHALGDTEYGIGKREAADVIAAATDSMADVLLPHLFGECARPDYNNVTATLIDRIWSGREPVLNPEGVVHLLHVGMAADMVIDAALARTTGQITPPSRTMKVPDLYAKLLGFHEQYSRNIFPDVDDPFDLAMFNSYRTGGFPGHYPLPMTVHSDARGILFESAKGGNAAQTMLSTTVPGAKRGDHFHLGKVERFLVVKGDAIIRIRRVLSDEVSEFRVSGDRPVAIDMPPLHTHNIENTSDEDVLTLFWSHDMFDPKAPDTYADPV